MQDIKSFEQVEKAISDLSKAMGLIEIQIVTLQEQINFIIKNAGRSNHD